MPSEGRFKVAMTCGGVQMEEYRLVQQNIEEHGYRQAGNYLSCFVASEAGKVSKVVSIEALTMLRTYSGVHDHLRRAYRRAH